MYRLLLAAFVSCIVTASGCGCNAALVKGVDAGLSAVAPEYRSYVTADPNLDERSKAIRLRTLAELLALIEEAKKE